ncbi:pentatricopeptide repeat-containing protein At4g38150-like [Mercurialis annua]|uniref:pentatricopeptide repeat-containing protein At4g38150-like n=1 Tax=Mercurialis annua TaxID=3986 RepID=UPI0024AF9C66|nr:pentatricopeptide repeat-containing protein At4g38150-like [Mercurialis annua]
MHMKFAMAQANKLRLCFTHSLLFKFSSSKLPLTFLQQHFLRSFCTHNKPTINTKVNFSPSHSDSDSDTENDFIKKEIDKSQLPPPYNPFDKKPIPENSDDPNNLQLIFHKMRSEGLQNNAVKMFDALSKDGLTHEALQLFSHIKNKGHMPDVVAYTAVIEAYANAGGQSKEALKAFMKMLAVGVAPNAYTYTVLIKGLAGDGKLSDSSKYLLKMMGKGMRPNAGTYGAVFEAYAKAEKVEEAKFLLQQMRGKGFVADEKAVREVLSNKRGQVFRTVINILFDK